MSLTIKEVVKIFSEVVGFFLFMYLVILSFSPIVYFANKWADKWEIKQTINHCIQ